MRPEGVPRITQGGNIRPVHLAFADYLAGEWLDLSATEGGIQSVWRCPDIQVKRHRTITVEASNIS